MSLRKVRSLPSLRVLAEASSPFVKEIPPAIPFQIRNVHNTKKNDHSPLLSSDVHASFTRMSLKSLKTECRTRGLKVSGKKSELVERILLFEGKTSQLHTSALNRAKNDSSHIDSMKIPNIASLEDAVKAKRADYIVQVPTLTADAVREPKADVGDDHGKPLVDIVGAVATPDAENVIKTPSVTDPIKFVNEEEEEDSSAKSKSNQNRSTGDEDLSSRDKKFLLGFAGSVAAWWSLKLWGKGKSKK